MPKAFILCEQTEAPSPKLAIIKWVMQTLAFEVEVLDDSLCDGKRVERLETQSDARDGAAVDYLQQAFRRLSNHAQEHDVILPTAKSHHEVFKGLDFQGKFCKADILLFWPEYLVERNWAAIFPSHYHLGASVGKTSHVKGEALQRWTVIRPCPNCEARKPEDEVSVYETCFDRHLSLEFFWQLCRGRPVVAPRWGAWRELVPEQLVQSLYLNKKCRDAALEAASRMSASSVLNSLPKCDPGRIAKQVDEFLSKACHG
jgi:hypothetical protein